jgi:signal transduction histidine kinase/ActR/RegA family two-component response regulator
MPRLLSVEKRILIFAPIGRDGRAVHDLLQKAGMHSIVCVTLRDLVERIEEGAAAAFVAEEGLVGAEVDRLRHWVEAQPAWSDLPFVILTSRRDQRPISEWRQQIVDALRNVSLLERPVQTVTLTSTLQACVRARLRQYEVRELLCQQAEAARQLEGLVAARTADLESTNLELRAQIAERAKAEEALRHSQKIEALGQLTGGVAHDFNNLLMVITGGLEMLLRNPPSARRSRLIEGMQKAAQRGADLTRQLLAFSRRQPLKPQPVDLARHIGGMRDLLDRSLRGDVEVVFDVPDDLWPAEVDPGELELVILNLAVNARDAMPEGGRISICASNAPRLRPDDKDWIRLSVMDAGTGMSDEVKRHVFEPFFTTKEIGRGSGLGLAQVHGFATQSGGTVEVDSTPGHGTTITLVLPRSMGIPETSQTRRSEPCGDGEQVHTTGQVLLVEDDDEVAALVEDMLGQLGYTPARVSSAKAALGALADGRHVDLVLSDVMMPGGMSGLDLAREIRQRRPSLPLLLTSAFAEAIKRDAEQEGIAVLPKPYLLGDLELALKQARESREPAPTWSMT